MPHIEAVSCDGGPPIGCNVKRESGAVLCEFSARLSGVFFPACQPTPVGPAAHRFAQEAEDTSFTLLVFFAWFRHTCLTPPSQGRAGPTLLGARRASITKAHRALVLALTGGVGSPQPEPGRLTGALLRLR